MSNWTEDNYDDFEEDDHWEDDVPEHWWADYPFECADEQYETAKP